MLKNRYYIFLLVFLSCARQSSFAQDWEIVGGGLSWHVGDMNIDTATNSLYIGGAFHYADTIACAGIINWNGNSFNKLNLPMYNCGSFNCSPVSSILNYHGRLFMTGYFGPYNGIEEQLFEYVNGNWVVSCTITTSGGISCLKIINDKLFALGIFDSLCNKSVQSLAVFNGTDWDVFNSPTPIVFNPNISSPSYWLFTSEYYKGEYYFGGNFEDSNGFNEVIRWTGTQWVPLQTGIHGSFAMVFSMKVYKDILYVGGYFYKADGNASNCLMAWDGQNWFDPFPQVDFSIDAVRDLEVINDQLYISGNYIIPADNDSNMYVLSRFDGCNFNVFGGTYKYPDFANAPSCIAGLKNRIYVAVNDSFLHKSAKYLISFPENTPNTKTINISPCPKTETYTSINIFPNPYTNYITIQIADEYILSETKFIITNSLGQLLMTINPNNVNQLIDLSSLSSGMYFLTVTDNINKKTVKIIKQ